MNSEDDSEEVVRPEIFNGRETQLQVARTDKVLVDKRKT